VIKSTVFILLEAAKGAHGYAFVTETVLIFPFCMQVVFYAGHGAPKKRQPGPEHLPKPMEIARENICFRGTWLHFPEIYQNQWKLQGKYIFQGYLVAFP